MGRVAQSACPGYGAASEEAREIPNTYILEVLNSLLQLGPQCISRSVRNLFLLGVSHEIRAEQFRKVGLAMAPGPRVRLADHSPKRMTSTEPPVSGTGCPLIPSARRGWRRYAKASRFAGPSGGNASPRAEEKQVER